MLWGYGLSTQCVLFSYRAMWCLSFTVVFGEDVAFGGVFRCTIGLKDKYGRLLSVYYRLKRQIW